ncbi:hypothetical protein ALC53_03822 [Atta colombica]|uniref:Uncharacterized protein n=1 Tax=Atta colombica TaxID=520822 RepID=A0A195BLQ3_9HYME|nr:hypothetical protein ALC53_03822 [Atta colombica]
MDRNQRPVSWSTHGGLLLCWAHHHWPAPPLSDLCHALLTYATPGRPSSIRYASTKRAPHCTRSLRYRESASTRVRWCHQEQVPRRQQLVAVAPTVTEDDVASSLEARGVTVCTVYALDRTASAGLGVVGGVGVGVGGGGGGGGICGPPTASLAPTDYVTAACYPPGSQLTLTATHPQPHVVDPAMTPTSAPVPTPTSASGPNNPVAMSQLGTVYATKRRRRNGKRSVRVR